MEEQGCEAPKNLSEIDEFISRLYLNTFERDEINVGCLLDFYSVNDWKFYSGENLVSNLFSLCNIEREINPVSGMRP